MRPSTSFVCLSRWAAVLLLVLFMATVTYAQITPSADAYTNTADPTTNYGAATLLYVDGTTEVAYIQFNLSSIPTGASVSQATLKLYVNAVTKAGSFNVDYVNGTWTESKLTSSLAPALGTTIVSSIPITTASKNQYILINITPAVQAWLSGSQANDGIALVANGTFNASFDSKENTTTSHPAELDIVFAGGGTITGITTASGSGLTGGGTSGTLNLSLITSCGSGQVLEWNGSVWACTNLSGGGTITGVTAGTDLTGGGTSGNVTLYLDTTKVPQLNSANTFTGNQTVNGNLSATGTVTGSSFGIGSYLFAFGSSSLGNAFLGFAGNTTMTGGANTATGAGSFVSNTTGFYNTAAGFQALELNTGGSNNTATGLNALAANTTGSYNTASGAFALRTNTGSGNTAAGFLALNSNTTGNDNSATGAYALQANTTAAGNTATGAYALQANTKAAGNTADGAYALQVNSLGTNNVGVGYEALYSNVGDSATDGWYNTAVGYQALYTNNGTGGTSGVNYASENTATGYQALYSNTSGSCNTAVGSQALLETTSGGCNTAVGVLALYTNQTGGDLTCIGADCDSADGLSNATAIGAHARVAASNSLVLGGTGKWAVKVGIGTTKPSNILTIAQGAGHPVSDSWETYSSLRWKTNIQTLHGALVKVEQLRGVSYDLKANGQHEVGVIAEEVGAVVPEVVTWEKNGIDAQSVDYGRLTALLIEATKEQQALIREQKEQIRAQQGEIAQQQTQIARLTRQVKTIQSTLKAGGRNGSEVRTVKAEARTVRQ